MPLDLVRRPGHLGTAPSLGLTPSRASQRLGPPPLPLVHSRLSLLSVRSEPLPGPSPDVAQAGCLSSPSGLGCRVQHPLWGLRRGLCLSAPVTRVGWVLVLTCAPLGADLPVLTCTPMPLATRLCSRRHLGWARLTLQPKKQT